MSSDGVFVKVHVYRPGGPDSASHPDARTACGMRVKGLAMRRQEYFVEEHGRRRCSVCVAKFALEASRR